jgi:hypothetical protein
LVRSVLLENTFLVKTQEKSEKILSNPLNEYVTEFSAVIVGKKKYVKGQDFISF